MKSLLIITIATFSFVRPALSVGLIHFFNTSSTLVTLSSNGVNLGPTPGVLGLFRYELFIAPTGTTDQNQFVATGVQATNLAVAGRLNGGSNRSVAGVNPGLNGAILIRGWSTSLGNDYSTALSLWNSGEPGYLGESSIATPFLFGGDDGSGVIPSSPPFGAAFYQINTGFVLSTVPEPTSLGLCSIALGLLVWRRR